MEITDLSWNENLSKRFKNPLLPRSIRGLIVGKSGCGKTTLLLNLLLKPGWLDYDTLFVFGKSLFQPEYKILRTAFAEGLPKEYIVVYCTLDFPQQLEHVCSINFGSHSLVFHW